MISDAVGHCGDQAMQKECGWFGLMEEKGWLGVWRAERTR